MIFALIGIVRMAIVVSVISVSVVVVVYSGSCSSIRNIRSQSWKCMGGCSRICNSRPSLQLQVKK